VRLQVFSPYGLGKACFGDADQPGRLAATHAAEGGALLDIELPRPQPFGLLYETTPAAAGVDLADLPFITGSVSGGLLHEGSVWGSGSISADEVDGTPCKAISGHPPGSGRTALDWCVQLPAEPLRLQFHVQVRKGGGPVAFEVQVNGQSLWHLPMPYPSGWKEGAVDLAPWAGKPVLLSLVTDSVGSNNCDWAAWGDVRLAAP